MSKYKRSLRSVTHRDTVGESWEISVEPSFPSLTESGKTLSTVIAQQPRDWLGPNAAAFFNNQLPLLVKLVDAGEALSVQVHPSWTDPTLAPEESGKLEYWLILDADVGSGIYLGFREGVDEPAVRSCLGRQGRLDELLNFVPVLPGEGYVIRPGTPHALGKGVTLVEPQLLTPPKVAATYRYWDWNRLYDDRGRPSPVGKSRTIDVARSIAVTSWSAPRGTAFVDTCRVRPHLIQHGDITCRAIQPEFGLSVREWQGNGVGPMPGGQSISALTCVGGSAEVAGVHLACGESAVVPAALGDFRVVLHDAVVVQAQVDWASIASRSLKQ